MTASRFGRNAALVAAVLGWLFDGFEIGLFPLIGPRALDDLLAAEMTANPAVKDAWFGSIMAVFLVGAACGGVLFGWLGDKIGRVRAMSASILTYAIFTGVCGFATDAWQIAAARFVASLGMGGEWALAVALAAGRFGRRIVYAGLCLASIASIAWLYLGAKAYGGTVLAAAPLVAFFARGLDPARVEVEAFPRAGLWLSGIYLAGAALIWLIPETKGRPLPE
jgi:MFS family permease